MNWLKHRKIYFLISATLIGACIYGLLTWGLRLGVDFRGGTLLEYNFDRSVSNEEIISALSESGFEVSSVQTTGETTYLIRLSPIELEEKELLTSVLTDLVGSEVEELRFETVGPAIGPELMRKTIYAIIIAASGILLWIAFQFRNLKFGLSAVLATLHDSFILIGSFAFLGHFYGAEVDFLIVTAVLTTLSFSVHDTIVVFDRIRENMRIYGGEVRDIADKSVTETIVRSLNNSFTLIFMLVAIILLGGTTIKWFAVALLIGTFFGTYSSPFVAVPLLVTWEEIVKKFRSKR